MDVASQQFLTNLGLGEEWDGKGRVSGKRRVLFVGTRLLATPISLFLKGTEASGFSDFQHRKVREGVAGLSVVPLKPRAGDKGTRACQLNETFLNRPDPRPHLQQGLGGKTRSRSLKAGQEPGLCYTETSHIM